MKYQLLSEATLIARSYEFPVPDNQTLSKEEARRRFSIHYAFHMTVQSGLLRPLLTGPRNFLRGNDGQVKKDEIGFPRLAAANGPRVLVDMHTFTPTPISEKLLKNGQIEDAEPPEPPPRDFLLGVTSVCAPGETPPEMAALLRCLERRFSAEGAKTTLRNFLGWRAAPVNWEQPVRWAAPYDLRAPDIHHDASMPKHASVTDPALLHIVFEIRNDAVRTQEAQAFIGHLLASALRDFEQTPEARAIFAAQRILSPHRGICPHLMPPGGAPLPRPFIGS